MREIFFRGKRAQGGAWVYGDFYKSDINKYERESGKATLIFTPDIDTFIYIREQRNSVMVIPETIGQYTGLTDKNGTRIFEGDILKIIDDEGNTDFSDGGVGNVEFAYGLWYVSGKPQNGLWDLLQAYYCEVLGNIYDNPELLKGAEK